MIKEVTVFIKRQQIIELSLVIENDIGKALRRKKTSPDKFCRLGIIRISVILEWPAFGFERDSLEIKRVKNLKKKKKKKNGAYIFIYKWNNIEIEKYLRWKFYFFKWNSL